MEDKFKLFRKWFWVGVVVATLNFTAGLIYGIALAVEKEHLKEGIVIIVWSFIAAAVAIIYVLPYLRSL